MLGVVSVLLVAWMVAVPLASSPYPDLAAEASGSSIVRGVNDVMPDGMRSLYSRLRGYLDQSGFPPVFGDLPSTTIVNVAPPASLTPKQRQRVRVAAQSTFKIYGQAPSCGRGIEGSGFVVSPHHIMTNAHVVAGTNQVGVVVASGQQLPATVVLYDPNRDVAILDVPDLHAKPAAVHRAPRRRPATARSCSATRRTARSTPAPRGCVRGRRCPGRTSTATASVRREVYSIRALVRSGNSGGPLLADDGSVLGVVFATDLRSSDTGYVLTAGEVAERLRDGTAGVDTGRHRALHARLVARTASPTGSARR